MKLTIKKFYRVSGASTQKKGVTPDIVLPAVVNEAKEIGEAALENPLEWDTIRSAKFDHLNLVEPYMAELRNRSSQRINTDPEFAYVHPKGRWVMVTHDDGSYDIADMLLVTGIHVAAGSVRGEASGKSGWSRIAS